MRALAIVAAGALGSSACWTASPAGPTTPPTPARPVGTTPDVRARALVQAQIDANQMSEFHPEGGDAARDREFRDTFASDAVVTGPLPGGLAKNLETTMFARTEIAQLSAGGTDDAIWFVATFRDTAPDGARNPGAPPNGPPDVYVGVATRDHAWKIVAAATTYAAFTDDDVRTNVSTPGAPIPFATPATTLTKLVLDGPALAKVLTPDATVVLGTRPPQRGPAALGRWADRTLTMYGGTHELIGPRWGVVQVHAAVMPPRLGALSGSLTVLALATRTDPASTWTPIFVQYLVD